MQPHRFGHRQLGIRVRPLRSANFASIGPITPVAPSHPSSAYAASIASFLATDDRAVQGTLAGTADFSLTPEQRSAWREELPILRHAVGGLTGWLYLEYEIPRLGRRVDAVVVVPQAVIVIEFKVGADTFDVAAHEQVWDYALDLKNFHAPSHAAPILPVLCATAASAEKGHERWKRSATDGIRPPFWCNALGLAAAIRAGLNGLPDAGLDPATWGAGVYRPTPTIIEAARAMYARHEVHDILRHDAGAQNLAATAGALETIITACRTKREKAIVFVTGVPGAGKTLVGLNVATRHAARDRDTHAAYLSGNGPLVRVLTEALARDELAREKPERPGVRKGEVKQRVESFIQIVHRWRDYHLSRLVEPDDHIVIFDEAQRAWHADKLGRFMKTRKKRDDITMSEPAVLLDAMHRHREWCVVICLVGGGQEINDGEAGIGEWLRAVREHFPSWRVHVSDQITDAEYRAGGTAAHVEALRPDVTPSLHLATSMRSFRAEHVSTFVKALLDGDAARSSHLLDELASRYPVRLTRRLRSARRWVRAQRRGSERMGIVASSSAERLKPHAIDVRVSLDPVHWFLAGADDTRSSNYLEDAATEFDVQGLELDWTIVTWDADLRWQGAGWSYHKFRGAMWQHVRKDDRRAYLTNAYRVLLTRARQGMVLFVPQGSKRDRTRRPEYYDKTYEYLRGLGIPEV